MGMMRDESDAEEVPAREVYVIDLGIVNNLLSPNCTLLDEPRWSEMLRSEHWYPKFGKCEIREVCRAISELIRTGDKARGEEANFRITAT